MGTAVERAAPDLWPGMWFDANGFGNRYQFPNGAWAVHTGIDFNLNFPVWNSDANKPVFSTADGVVIYSQLVAGSTWGRLVVVKHPDGACSRYGHLRLLTAGVGQAVVRGQQVGTVGGTEYGLPDHLHFDISPSGILETNPIYWPGDDLPAVLQHFVNPREWIGARH